MSSIKLDEYLTKHINSSKTETKTKIIATLGPSSNTYEQVRDLALAGVNVFRLNFSHGTHETKRNVIKHIQVVNKEYNLNLAILGDLQGPKIRIGEIEFDKLEVKTGNILCFTNKKVLGRAEHIYVSYEGLANDVKKGDKILIDDGKIETKVIDIKKAHKEVYVKVLIGGEISSNKGLNLPNSNIKINAITKKDIKDINFAIKENFEWIALSFVQRPEDIIQLRDILNKKKSKIKIIAKIEKPQALKHINEIIHQSDAIMIARGDLGVELPVEKISLIQNTLIRKCIHRSKPVVVATQMMESMLYRLKPNRSDITDVANAVRDGTDAVMLSGETANGKHPTLVVKTMKKIILEVELHAFDYNKEKELKAISSSPSFLSDAICYNTCKIAHDLNAKAIVGMTQSGYTGMRLSSYRPKSTLIIFVTNQYLTNQLSLCWGVKALFFKEKKSIDEIYFHQVQILKKENIITKNDMVVFTGSIPVKDKLPTNMIKVEKIK